MEKKSSSSFNKQMWWLFFGSGLVAIATLLLRQWDIVSDEFTLWTMLLCILVSTITSVIVIPNMIQWLHNRGIMEKMPYDLRDEVDDLNQGKIARPHIMIGFCIVFALIYAGFYLAYGKLFNGVWFEWVNALVPTVLIGALLYLVVRRTEWYKDRDYRVPTWVFVLPILGFILSLGLGIYMTEPVGDSGMTQHQIDQARDAGSGSGYNYQGTRAYYYFFASSNSSGSHTTSQAPSFSSSSSFKCSGKSCGGIGLFLLLLALIIIVLVLIFGAAVLPHFWVLSCALLLLILLIMTLQEIRRDRRYDY